MLVREVSEHAADPGFYSGIPLEFWARLTDGNAPHDFTLINDVIIERFLECAYCCGCSGEIHRIVSMK